MRNVRTCPMSTDLLYLPWDLTWCLTWFCVNTVPEPSRQMVYSKSQSYFACFLPFYLCSLQWFADTAFRENANSPFWVNPCCFSWDIIFALDESSLRNTWLSCSQLEFPVGVACTQAPICKDLPSRKLCLEQANSCPWVLFILVLQGNLSPFFF